MGGFFRFAFGGTQLDVKCDDGAPGRMCMCASLQS
jgi:hypothetical protein